MAVSDMVMSRQIVWKNLPQCFQTEQRADWRSIRHSYVRVCVATQTAITMVGRSQSPRGHGHRSAAARLLLSGSNTAGDMDVCLL